MGNCWLFTDNPNDAIEPRGEKSEGIIVVIKHY
jgi:hypothetical protein